MEKNKFHVGDEVVISSSSSKSVNFYPRPIRCKIVVVGESDIKVALLENASVNPRSSAVIGNTRFVNLEDEIYTVTRINTQLDLFT